MTKMTKAFGLSIEALTSNKPVRRNRLRALRNILSVSQEQISSTTDISIRRLKEIEAGDKMTLAEERDLALCLSTTVYALRGTYLLDAPISRMDDFVQLSKGEMIEEYSGFWGHVGIMIDNADEYQWYPITRNTKNLIHQTIDQKFMVIPCMNNKVILINTDHLKEIRLLDEACDQPQFANWDQSISEGEIPQVIYEALDDYIDNYYEGYQEADVMSKTFFDFMQGIVKDKGWDEDTIYGLMNNAIIYYGDGTSRMTSVLFDEYENISNKIAGIIDFGDGYDNEKTIQYEDSGASCNIVMLDKVGMLELPYASLEKKMYHNFVEMLADLGEVNEIENTQYL